MPNTFIDKIKSTLKKYHMLESCDKILIGLSGGIDSVVLSYVLNFLKEEYRLDICIAHLDHKFRAQESTLDRKFCEEAARKLGIEIVCEEIDVPKVAKERGLSIEEAARFERYGFFSRAAGIRKIKKIAVGHTKDDQAETVLMRMIRGAGILGLGGISPVKNMQGRTIIRPLIETSRVEIEDFARKNNLLFRYDSSNDNVILTRNRIRHELVPYLEKNFNPNIKEVLSNMAENLRVENEFLEKFSMRKFKGMSRIKPDEIAIDIKKIKKQPKAIKKRILRSALGCFKGNLRTFTYQHWREMDDLITNRPVNSIVDLPGGINIIKRKKELIIQR